MDAAFVMSGGASSLVTAPLKGGAIEGGKNMPKNIFERATSGAKTINASESSGGYRSRWSGRKSGNSSNGLCFYG